MNTPPDPPAEIELPDDVPTLQALVRELLATVATLQEQVRVLTEQVHRNSSNSSRPPSSDPPWRQRPQKPASGRKRGGQKGHPGTHRELVPVHEVDQLLVVSPTACDYCGEAFAAEVPRRRKFRRWQCVELPPIRPEVTEYQLLARRCTGCRRRTWARLPPGVARRCVGPRVQALAAVLSGACRLSRRQVQSLLADLCGIRLSLGTLVALEADTAQALAQPYAELAAAVPQARVLGVDETSWREAGTLHWLWTAVTRQFAFYRIDRYRSRAALTALLKAGESVAGEPPPTPVIISDRYSAYGHLPWRHAPLRLL